MLEPGLGERSPPDTAFLAVLEHLYILIDRCACSAPSSMLLILPIDQHHQNIYFSVLCVLYFILFFSYFAWIRFIILVGFVKYFSIPHNRIPADVSVQLRPYFWQTRGCHLIPCIK